MPSKVSESSSKIFAGVLPHQEELQHLGDLADIHMHPKVFRILVAFLNMGVDPTVIYGVLKSIRRSRSSRHRSSMQLPLAICPASASTKSSNRSSSSDNKYS